MLFIEYDVNSEGEIELVALINAVEEDGQDPEGEAWLAWRATHDDEGMGCVGVSPAALKAMESTEDPEELLAIVERVILADRASKEEVAS
ncbi:MAG: hypothetical protein ABSB99_10335 [Acidimicrobiales bacterium]